jgi:hypothetical protein
VPPDVHHDFLRKCDHVRRILLCQGVRDSSTDTASEWVLAFSDEGDPTFCVLEWLEAGWRDPLLVARALAICGTRESAEECMDWLGEDLAGHYRPGVTIELVRAVLALAGEPPRNDL